MSHTPGPWIYCGSLNPEHYPVWRIENANGGFVADTNRCDEEHIEMEVYTRKDAKNMEDTARLIAAAPDLLEALQSLLKVVERTPQAMEGFNMISVERAREAIRKAIGD